MSKQWARINRHLPCPICGRIDWCLISTGGEVAICARVESDKPAGNKGAGWIHKLDTSKPLPPLHEPKQQTKQTLKAPPHILDMTYRALLAELQLSTNHRENLQHRGLTDAQIVNLGYRTLSIRGRRELVMRLDAKGIRLAGVPGFYREDEHWELAGPVGIAIPIKDIRSRIGGLQVRCDVADNGKYKWLSSRGYNAGCSPGVPVHVAGPVSTNSVLFVTEGVIKADIAALKLGCTVLAVAGVGNWLGVIPIIRELRPERVITSYDMDKVGNPAVKLHSEALIAFLIGLGIRTYEADWNVEYKGIDDLLMQGAIND